MTFFKTIRLLLLLLIATSGICRYAVCAEAYSGNGITVSPGTAANTPDSHARNYIVVLKPRSVPAGPDVLSVRHAAERLLYRTRAHEMSQRFSAGGISADTMLPPAVPGRVYARALKGFTAQLTPGMVAFLGRDPAVAFIEADSEVQANAWESPVPSWGLDRIDQEALPLNDMYRYDFNGAGVQVYILDTGVLTTHRDFTGRTGDGYDFVDNDDKPVDCNGHGTHVAGTTGGTLYGVAKAVVIHPVRVLNCYGSGRVSDVIAGIDWIDAHHISPAVVNMSLGGGASDALDKAIRRAIRDGVTFVVAAGNSGTDACRFSPARVSEAITVAASGRSDKRAYFSNYGRCTDLFAPGVNITSDWPGKKDDEPGGTSRTLSGTSMAAPHVTGVVALYLQEHPEATPAQTKKAILAGSVRGIIKDPGRDTPDLLLNVRAASGPANQ